MADFKVGDAIKKVKDNKSADHDFFPLGSIAKIKVIRPNFRPQVEGYSKHHDRVLSQNIDVNDWELVTDRRDMPVLQKAISGLKKQTNEGRAACYDCGAPTESRPLFTSIATVCTKCEK